MSSPGTSTPGRLSFPRSPGEESRKTSAVSANPPRLEAVLTDEGSHLAFAIFVQEQVNAAVPASMGCSNLFGPSPDLHNNGVPGMLVGCGTKGCVDVFFYYQAWKWQSEVRQYEERKDPALVDSLIQSAKDIFTRFLLNPSEPDHYPHFKHRYPPLHITVTTENIASINSTLTEATNNHTVPTQTLFQELAHTVYSYLNDTYFALFLNTLAFDHLEAEALLLAPSSAKRMVRSAHNLYKEEYCLFYLDYEEIRTRVEEGPPSEEAGRISNVGDMSVPSSRKPAAQTWFENVIGLIDAAYRRYFRPHAEFAVYIESDVRTALVEALKTTHRNGKLDYNLLNTFLTIKDYAVEVIKFDILPQYHLDAKIGHRRQRRASLMSATVTKTKPSAEVIPVPVLQSPLSLDPNPTAVPADAVALAASSSSTPSSSASSTTPAAASTAVSPSSSSSSSSAGGLAAKRSSLIAAAVDVPLGARRTSHRGSLKLKLLLTQIGANNNPSAAATEEEKELDKARETLDGTIRGTHDDEPNSPGGRGPAPPVNPKLRSMEALKARRSLIGGSIIMPSQAAINNVAQQMNLMSKIHEKGKGSNGGTPGDKSDAESEDGDDDDEEEDEDDAPPPAPSNAAAVYLNNQRTAEQFKLFQQNAVAPKNAPNTEGAASTAGMSAAAAAASGLKRRSVIATSMPSAATNASSSSTSSSDIPDLSIGNYAPFEEKSIHFDLTEKGPLILSADKKRCAPRSILKSKVRSETIEEVLKRVFAERMREAQIHLPVLKAGCLIMKFNAAGKAAERWFKLSDDTTELEWGKVDEKTKVPLRGGLFNRIKKFPLADVTRIRYGSSNSKRFAKYNLSAKSMPWMAWSVYFPEKTLDLVCKTEQEVTEWYQGIQALVPLSSSYLSKAGVVWRRVQMKIRFYSMWQNIEPILFIEDLLAAARQDVPLGRLPATPVVDLLNVQIAATPEDNGSKKK